MTIIEAINTVDALKQNTFPQADKVRWLSELDGRVFESILSTRQTPAVTDFDGYTAETDPDTVLLIPAPYEDVYIQYLSMQMDYYNGETVGYANARAVYNSLYAAFAGWYNRHHLPAQKPRVYR